MAILSWRNLPHPIREFPQVVQKYIFHSNKHSCAGKVFFHQLVIMEGIKWLNTVYWMPCHYAVGSLILTVGNGLYTMIPSLGTFSHWTHIIFAITKIIFAITYPAFAICCFNQNRGKFIYQVSLCITCYTSNPQSM